MLWAQVGASFVIWVVGGLATARWASSRLLPRLGRGALTVLGPVSLLAGLCVLLAGLWAAWALGGVQGGTMKPLPWAVATVTGVGFAALQSFGALCLLAVSYRSETTARAEASEHPEK